MYVCMHVCMYAQRTSMTYFLLDHTNDNVTVCWLLLLVVVGGGGVWWSLWLTACVLALGIGHWPRGTTTPQPPSHKCE